MDDVVNRLARELAEAIGVAVVDDPGVEAIRERARAAGFEMKVSLEAVIGFANRTNPKSKQSPVVAMVKAVETQVEPEPVGPKKKRAEMTTNDRRFLRSLRIASEGPKKEEVE
jgi:hypothetical protein